MMGYEFIKKNGEAIMYRILIVDDERIERRGIRFLLKKMGLEMEVFEASNGKEALEISSPMIVYKPMSLNNPFILSQRERASSSAFATTRNFISCLPQTRPEHLLSFPQRQQAYDCFNDEFILAHLLQVIPFEPKRKAVAICGTQLLPLTECGTM